MRECMARRPFYRQRHTKQVTDIANWPNVIKLQSLLVFAAFIVIF
jgi:hypothetical protein